MNALGYMRLSVRDQSRYSLQYQEESIRDYCARNDLELTAIYTDNGQCSDTFDRTDFQALEAFLKKHKGVNQYLIIMDHDRFSRDLSEALAKIKELEKKYLIKVLATDEDLDIDPADPNIFMQRAFRYLLANQELLRIRKRTRQGMRYALESGRYVGKAPFGYLNKKDSEGKGLIVVDDEKAPIVMKIFKDYLEGEQFFIIHKEVKKLGFGSNGNSAIPRLLSNCVYAGLVRIKGDHKHPDRYVKGIHGAIISEADYWLAQEMLGNKKPSKTQASNRFPLRGILNCWCGQRMTAGFSKGKRNYYLYYRCIHHTSVNLSGTVLHEKFSELLEALSFTANQVTKIAEQVKKFLKDTLNDNEKILVVKNRQLDEVNKKIEELEDSYFKKDIELSTYKRWFAKHTAEKGHILDEIRKASAKRRTKWDKLHKLLPHLCRIKDIYENCTLLNKHKLIRVVFKHNLTFSEGTFRTPHINEAFAHNYLTIKEKGLLLVEQPSVFLGSTPVCSP